MVLKVTKGEHAGVTGFGHKELQPLPSMAAKIHYNQYGTCNTPLKLFNISARKAISPEYNEPDNSLIVDAAQY